MILAQREKEIFERQAENEEKARKRDKILASNGMLPRREESKKN